MGGPTSSPPPQAWRERERERSREAESVAQIRQGSQIACRAGVSDCLVLSPFLTLSHLERGTSDLPLVRREKERKKAEQLGGFYVTE